MPETWVLIALIITGTPRTVPIVAEFTSEQRCKAAGDKLVAAVQYAAKGNTFPERIGYQCTLK